MHIVLRSVRSRKKSTEKKHSTSSHHTCWWFIPRLFSKVFVSENQFEPVVFMYLLTSLKWGKKYTYSKWQPSCLCLREAEALVGLNWWPENETGAQTAEAPDWTTDGIKPFPCPFWSCFFTSQLNTTKNQFTSPTFVLFFY